jgi:hypothetical protein
MFLCKRLIVALGGHRMKLRTLFTALVLLLATHQAQAKATCGGGGDRSTSECRAWCANQRYSSCGHKWCYSDSGEIACIHGCEKGSKNGCTDGSCTYIKSDYVDDVVQCKSSCSFCSYNNNPYCQEACKDGCDFMLGGGTSPVTDTDCGANYVYDASKSASPCAGTTCDASGTDRGTCCVAQVRL